MKKIITTLLLLSSAVLTADEIESFAPVQEEAISSLCSLFCPDCWEQEVKTYSDEGYLNSRKETRETSPYTAIIECEAWDQELSKDHACKDCAEYLQKYLANISFGIGFTLLLDGHVLENFHYEYVYADESRSLIQFSIAFQIGEEKCRSETYLLLEIGEKIGKATLLDFDLIHEAEFEELCSPEFQQKCVEALLSL